jgi:hypothetical protein
MKRTLIKILTVALTFGAMLVAPRNSEAASVLINNLSVTVGGVTWCIAGCAVVGANGPIWGAAAGTLVHSPSEGGTQALVLTQTGAGNQFNFDSSDRGGTGAACSPGAPCATTLTINGVAIALSGAQVNALANFNTDDASIIHQEASAWGPAVFNGGPGGLVVWFGYADTAHNSACTDTTGVGGEIAGDCTPNNPWQGSPNTTFIGGTVTTAPGAGCDKTGITSCIDAGAIRIQVNDVPVTTPEPSVLMMLGVGLVAIAFVTRKLARNNA